MAVYRIDPLRDPRWATFLSHHPQASIFHTTGWLDALRRTYKYQPVVYTTSAPDQALTNGLAFCRINSWLTGSRMVSVPFADHCHPLVDNTENLRLLVSSLKSDLEGEKWRYVEIRPPTGLDAGLIGRAGFEEAERFYFHELDLRPDQNTLFRNLHKSCVQKKIQRAERERLTYEEGRSESILAKFYHLLLLTRRRHQLPPQPLVWFRNLIGCVREQLKIRIVSKDGQSIAGILTLSYKRALVYKYGCSDARFHSLGGMPLLFWKTIQEGKELGAEEFDLGRSKSNNPGLVTFKDHLGAARSKLNYYRCPLRPSVDSGEDWRMHFVRHTCAWLPDPLLTVAGRLLYRHIG